MSVSLTWSRYKRPFAHEATGLMIEVPVETVEIVSEGNPRVILEVRCFPELVEGFVYAVFTGPAGEEALVLHRDNMPGGGPGLMKALLQHRWATQLEQGELHVLRSMAALGRMSAAELEEEHRRRLRMKHEAEERAGKLLEERREGVMPTKPEGGLLDEEGKPL